MRFLFVGDIVGSGGRKAFATLLPQLKSKYNIDTVIVNVENSANGFGVTEKVYKELMRSGADIMTSGNHIWDQKGTLESISSLDKLIRPANYPPNTPGNFFVKTNYLNVDIVVFNVMGRVFMPPMDCPFRAFDDFYMKNEGKIIIVDFHGEATSEKIAFANYVDGRASAVIGTHTHVQTNDDTVLPNGTLYLSDVGMCGAINSIIGMKKEGSLKRFVTGLPSKLEVEKKGKMRLNALFFEIDNITRVVGEFEKIKLEYGD